MVFIAPFIGAAVILSNLVAAMPQPVINGDVERRSSDYQSSNSKSSQGSSYGSSDNSNSYGSSSNYGSSNSYDSSSNNYGSSNSGSSYGSSKSGSSNSYGSGSSNSYGSGSSNSYGSGSSNGYGSSNSGSSNNYGSSSDTTSSVMEEATSTMMQETTSTMMEEATSTQMAEATSTAASYGSGSSNWNQYDNCVQQCMASFPPGSGSSYTAPIVNSGSNEGSYGGSSGGSGVTHTVIVAPMKGVFRMVPFATNASVGDTVKFMWGADGHTVTKGSQLEPCNKTADAFFTSGTQNTSFVFTQVVNDTNPTFFFCNTPGHCQKGMFGIINPASSFNAPTSASGQMQSLAAANLDLKTYASITDKATAGTGAALWGGSIDMAGMPDWAHEAAAENILFTRNLIAQNPEILKADGTLDLSSADTTPLMVPQDVAAVLANTGTTSASAPVQTTAAAAATDAGAAAAAAASAPASNGAGALASPRVLVALMAAVATFFIL